MSYLLREIPRRIHHSIKQTTNNKIISHTRSMIQYKFNQSIQQGENKLSNAFKTLIENYSDVGRSMVGNATNLLRCLTLLFNKGVFEEEKIWGNTIFLVVQEAGGTFWVHTFTDIEFVISEVRIEELEGTSSASLDLGECGFILQLVNYGFDERFHLGFEILERCFVKS